MSAFELNDLMMSWYAMMGQDASMYLALVSGYLLVAHYIGAKLSRAQSVVINVFFTVWTMLHVLALFSEMRAVVEIQQRLVIWMNFISKHPVKACIWPPCSWPYNWRVFSRPFTLCGPCVIRRS